jgi:hypothetical protein
MRMLNERECHDKPARAHAPQPKATGTEPEIPASQRRSVVFISQLKTRVRRPHLMALAVAVSALASLASVSPAYAGNCQLFGTCSPLYPVNTVPPTVYNDTWELTNSGWSNGSYLSTSTGSWTNSPTSYSYEWFLCNSSGSSCSLLQNAKSNYVSKDQSWVGQTVIAGVTATNSYGWSDTAYSAPTKVLGMGCSTYGGCVGS